eukprot:403350661
MSIMIADTYKKLKIYLKNKRKQTTQSKYPLSPMNQSLNTIDSVFNDQTWKTPGNVNFTNFDKSVEFSTSNNLFTEKNESNQKDQEKYFNLFNEQPKRKALKKKKKAKKQIKPKRNNNLAPKEPQQQQQQDSPLNKQKNTDITQSKTQREDIELVNISKELQKRKNLIKNLKHFPMFKPPKFSMFGGLDEQKNNQTEILQNRSKTDRNFKF